MMAGAAAVLEQLESALQRSPADEAAVLAHLEELEVALEAEAQSLSRGAEELESTIYFDPFGPLLVLSPLLGSLNSSTATSAASSVDSFATHSSAKEMAMLLGERLARRVPEDDEDDFGDGEEQAPAQPWTGKESGRELTQLVRVYGTVLPRIRALRPANFLSSAVDQMLGAVSALSQGGAFAGSSEPDAESSLLAAALLQAVASFVNCLVADPWIDAARDLCLPHLERLLLSIIALLHTFLPISIAHSFFVAAYPRYHIPSRDAPPHPALTRAWEAVLETARQLSLTPTSLFALATSRPSAESSAEPSSPLGAFVLLAHVLAFSPNLRPSTLGQNSSELISKTLRLLMSSFTEGAPGEAMMLSEDESLFWTWWCVQGAVREGEEIDESVLFTLVELLSTFASLSPDSSARFLAFRLLSTLILQGTEKEEVQLMVLKDLAEDCPFEQMRVASVGLLREVVASKFDRLELDSQEPSTPLTDRPSVLEPPVPFTSLFLSPLLLAELSSTLLRFDSVDLLTPPPTREPIDVTSFIKTHSKSTMEKLSLLYLLLARDEGDLTTVHATLATTEQLFLSPLRRALTRWLTEAEQSAELGEVLELEMLKGAVDRVDRVGRERSR